MGRAFLDCLPGDRDAFLVEGFAAEDEILDRLSKRLGLEYPNSRSAAGFHEVTRSSEVEGDDRDGTDLEERFVVLRLAPEIRLTLA